MSSKRRNHKPHQSPATVRRVTALHLSPTEWGVASGFGRAAFSIAHALKECGVDVAVIGKPQLVGDGPEIPRSETTPETILHIGDPSAFRLVDGKRNIGLTWWPFSKMPTSWYRSMYGLQRLIVPSQWCAQGAVLPQPHQSVHVVPLAIDSAVFHPIKRERTDTLRFLVFDRHADGYAAGADLAVRAFLWAFPESRKDVAMDIWTTMPADLDAPDERIQIRRHIGSDADLFRLYQRYDALIASARGCGFGLVPIEAMATGMPVFHSGQGAYEPIADLGNLIGARHRVTDVSAHESAQCFEPLFDVLGKRLQQLDNDYDAFASRAMNDAETVRSRFTWEQTAQGILDALEDGSATDKPVFLSERQCV